MELPFRKQAALRDFPWKVPDLGVIPNEPERIIGRQFQLGAKRSDAPTERDYPLSPRTLDAGRLDDCGQDLVSLDYIMSQTSCLAAFILQV
jgi:hypothetical protein